MSLFSSAMSDAADTTTMQAGGQSALAQVGDALQYGVGAAVISGLGSIYNTGAAGLNALGADVQQIDTYNKLQEMDTNWADYYKQNKMAIDTVGFIGTSFIPGTLAVKGLNAMRAGEGVGAFGRGLGFFRTQQAASLDKALVELAAEGGTVFTRINKNKLAAIGWGFADQALTAAAFETGVALTMKQSPLLADDSWWDIGKTALIGSAFGGIIGGSIDGLILNKGFKEAVTAIDGKQRRYDYVASLDNFGLAPGDKAYAIADSLISLPREVLGNDQTLALSFQLAGGKVIRDVDVSKILGNTLKQTESKALLDFQKTLNSLSTDSTVNQPIAEMLINKFTGARNSGMADADLRDLLGSTLFELKALRAATETPTVAASDLWYFKKALSADEIAGIKTIDEWERNLKSTTPFAENAYNKPYVFTGTQEQKLASFSDAARIGFDKERKVKAAIRDDDGTIYTAKSGSTHIHVMSQNTITGRNREAGFVTTDGKFLSRKEAEEYVGTGDSAIYTNSITAKYPTLAAAWKAGKDVAFLPDGTLRVNDASKLWRRVDDPVYSSSRYINTRTGAITPDTVLTAADSMVAGKALDDTAIRRDAVYLQQSGGTKVLDMKVFKSTGDSEYFTARHAWASKLADSDIPRVVDFNDFSLMDRLRTVSLQDAAEITVRDGERILGTVADIGLADVIRSSKLSESQRLLVEAYEAGKTLDTRALAYQLNVDPLWLEQAVASRFRDSMAGEIQQLGKVVKLEEGISLPLASYTRRENLIADFAPPQQFQDLQIIKPGMPWQERKLIIDEITAANGGQFVTGELAWGQRVRDAIALNENAAASVMTPERVALLPKLDQDAAKLADSQGAGASTFGFANAGYGDNLKLNVQETGKHVHAWIQQDTKLVVDAFVPVATAIRNKPQAAAELGIVTNLLRSTDEKYVFNVAAADGKQSLILRELDDLRTKNPAQFEAAKAAAIADGKRAEIAIEHPETLEFLKTHSALNDERVGKRTVLNNAKGMTSNQRTGTVYVPPVDTTYFQHFVFVRPIEGKAFGTSEVSMIFGRTADELSKRIASVDQQNFTVITKRETEAYFKAKELYDFDLTINEPRINSELRRSGALNNFQPEVRPENLIEDYMRWHQKQSTRLVRDSVETYYAQQFAELRKLGETYVDLATSRFSGTTGKSKTEIANPYDDYIKTALDVSKRSEYTLLHQANEFVDALGTRAYQGMQRAFGDAEKGIVNWEQANAQMEKLGIKGVYHYKDADSFFAANVPRDRNVIREYVAKANAFLANSVLRLDFFNSITNVVATPILLGTELASIRSLIKSDPALVGKLAELTSVTSPGGIAVPGTTKLIGNALKNFWGADKEALLARYIANGDVKDTLSQYHSMTDSLALRPDFKLFSDNVNGFFEKAAKFTMNEQAEQMTRFISADVMRELSDPVVEAGKMTLKEQNAYISVFTNRVQGNYVSSQRPIVFQGVLGSAVSLFQTYTFNIMQQLLRHVENKDKRAVATLFGMQAGTFGLNGTPFFEAVNTHLIGNAAVNQGHYDAYSLAPQLVGKQMGDWLMYGTASAMPAFFGAKDGPALYTRGDINPRHASIIPLNPADIPAIDVANRVVSNLWDTGKKLVGGADVSETLLQGLEHNGVNRPLAGFAQILNGKSTTSKGGLISASNDFSAITTASRILGAKPMDEAVALNNQYRLAAYRTADQDRMEHLGEKVKSFLGKNQFPPDDVMDDLLKNYAKAGGRVENFNAAMQRWSRDANQSTVEKMRAKMNTSYGQRLNEIMGGTPLDDYRNAPVQLEVPAQPVE